MAEEPILRPGFLNYFCLVQNDNVDLILTTLCICTCKWIGKCNPDLQVDMLDIAMMTVLFAKGRGEISRADPGTTLINNHPCRHEEIGMGVGFRHKYRICIYTFIWVCIYLHWYNCYDRQRNKFKGQHVVEGPC